MFKAKLGSTILQLNVYVILLLAIAAEAQEQVPFTPRYNEEVNGEIRVIANNMLSRDPVNPYHGDDGNNAGPSVYVDIDNDATTFNSSSANFVNPNPFLSCLTIRKVLLYWVAADKEPDNSNLNSENQPLWDYDDIKIMLPGQTTYNTLKADDVIFRGRDLPNHFSNDPYICVKDITTSVNVLTTPFGTYQVANVEAKEGTLIEHGVGAVNTGVSGGWQIVFVYESPTLPVKNVTIFDGYAHVTIVNNDFDVDFTGFLTPPLGNVQADITIGALEGDRDINGDRLLIRDVANNFVRLSTPQRPDNNFFNSRITVNGADFTDRNPASSNTLGFDSALFRLNNPGNSIIDNNQGSITFRMTSNYETYGLYMLGMAIDVWRPDFGPLTLTGNPPTNPLEPGATVGFEFNIQNNGNDDAQNLQISTTLAPEAQLLEPIAGLQAGVTYSYDGITRILTFFVADNLVEVDDPAFDINYQIQINDHCYFLGTDCSASFSSQFTATYNGALNPNVQTTTSSGTTNACGVGNEDPTVFNINPPDAAVWVTPPNALDRTVECGDADALSEAQALEPALSCPSLNPIKTSGPFVTDISCPQIGTYTNTWTFTDACGSTIEPYVQTIIVEDTTKPIATGGIDDGKVEACGADDVLTPATTVAELEALDGNLQISDSCTADADLTVSSTDQDDGNCPAQITRIYSISDLCGNEIQVVHYIGLTDELAPAVTGSITDTEIEGCSASDAPAVATTVAELEALAGDLEISDTCSADTDLSVNSTDQIDGTCPAHITRIYTITDQCGNEAQATHIINISDNLAPVATGSIADSAIEGCNALDAPTAATSVAELEALAGDLEISDSCETEDLLVSSTDQVDGTCPVQVTRIYTITDPCGNEAQATHIINISDNLAPVVTGSISDSAIEGCNALDAPTAATSVAELEALAGDLEISDSCETEDLLVSSTDQVDGTCPVQVTRIYTITDPCGNEAQATHIINISDNLAPAVTGSISDSAIEGCNALDAPTAATSVAELEALAGDLEISDTCSADTDLSVNSTDQIDGICPLQITRTYTISDPCGNETDVIHVIKMSDTTDPLWDTLPTDTSIDCDGTADVSGAFAVWLDSFSGTDNCGTATLSHNSNGLSDLCGATGSETVTFTLTDACGNSITQDATFTITDNTAPDFTVTPSNASSNTQGSDPDMNTDYINWLINNGNGVATDVCSMVTWSNNSATQSWSSNGCSESIEITFTITDECGNADSAPATFTITDTQPPEITVEAAEMTSECEGTDPDMNSDYMNWLNNNGGAEAVDVSGNAVVWSNNTASQIWSGSCPNSIAITFTATGPAGCVAATTTATYTIEDTTAPQLLTELQANIAVSCEEIPAIPELQFSDNCSNEVIPEFEETNSLSGSDPEYEIIREWRVSDDCGNDAVYTQTIMVTSEEDVIPISDSRCVDDGLIDLNAYLNPQTDDNGTWEVVLGDANLDGAVFDPSGLQLGDYIFQYVVTANSCLPITSVNLNLNDICVVLPCGDADVKVSMAVTPNGDMWNEYFEITGIDECGFTVEVQIFNRWGAKIFEAKNYQNDWTADSHTASVGSASKIPNGTYYYIITLPESGLKPKTGPVYIGTR